MGTAGLALSTAICSYLQVFILVRVLRKRLGPSILHGLSLTLAKTLAATVLCLLVGAAIMALCRNLPEQRSFDILRLAVVVPSAAGAYLLAAKFLNIEELYLLTGNGRNTR
jgi:peptidoglycan biosynthesis protein MviN/MurJ (putative lipid II flippase)